MVIGFPASQVRRLQSRYLLSIRRLLATDYSNQLVPFSLFLFLSHTSNTEALFLAISSSPSLSFSLILTVVLSHFLSLNLSFFSLSISSYLFLPLAFSLSQTTEPFFVLSSCANSSSKNLFQRKVLLHILKTGLLQKLCKE